MSRVNPTAKLTRVFILLAGSVLLWACSDSDNSSTSSSESSIGPAAVLNVRETGNLPGMLAIDATDSYPGTDGSFARFVVSIVDDSGVQKREIVIEDNFEQTIPHVLPEEDDAIVQYLNDNGEPKNIRGTYRIELTVETEGGLSDSAQAVVVLDRDIPVVRFTQLRPPAAVSSFARTADTAVLASFAKTADTTVLASSDDLDDESDCPAVSCANVSADDSENGLAYVACSLDEICNDVSPATLLTTLQSVYSAASFTLSDTSPLVISAYGAAGADGCNLDLYDGGNGGKGGFAQLYTTVTDVEDNYGDTLYYWTGSKGGCLGYKVDDFVSRAASGGDGGASTIVSWTETGSSILGYFLESDLLLVAGGGGGGNAASLSLGNGASGGHGSYDLYTAQSEYTADDGHDAAYITDYECAGSKGGTGNTGNAGGYGGTDGYEDDDNPGWYSDLTAPSVPPVGSYGAGGNADYQDGSVAGNPGGGGGGAGGGDAGGLGDTVTDDFYCGGGGGASMVAPSTYFDLSFEPDDRTSNDSDGAVYLYYFSE